MNDPYSILGVNTNASDEEIKKAYKEMARKYHPDNYADNPLSDLANDKMKEINEAYDTIMSQRSAQRNYDGGYSAWAASSNFSDIRNLIAQGRLEDAQELLDGVSPQQRDAEWYFLNGSVLYNRGWFEGAYTSFATACRMNPANPEYRAAYDRINRQRGGMFDGQGGWGQGGGSCTGCDICTTLICADCFCRCCCR